MNIEQKLTIVKTWSVIHLDMLKKFTEQYNKVEIKYIPASEEYARLFSSILKFFIPPMTPQAIANINALNFDA
jgi:hypothetical protein